MTTHSGIERGFDPRNGSFIDYFEKVYVTPWCRIGAFLVGMITKLFLEDYPCVLSTLKKILGTMLSLILILFCIFFPFYADFFPRWLLILYQSLCHSCWAVAMAWLIILCSTDQIPRFTRLLSWPIWTVLARFSYSAYLVHMTIILTEVYNRYSVIHYQGSVLFNGFLGQTLWTFLGSLFVIVLVESPSSTLVRKIRHYCQNKPRIIRINQPNYGTIE